MNARFWKNSQNKGRFEQFSKFCLRQQWVVVKEFWMEKILSNIVKTANIMKLTKIIQESSYRVLQVTSKWKTLKQPVYVFKAFEFWPTFDIQIDTVLAIFWGMFQNDTNYRKPTEVTQNTPTFISIDHTLWNKGSYKNEKICVFLGLFFQNKNCWHFEFLMNHIFGQRFENLKNWGIRANYCWNYGLLYVATLVHWISSI